MSGDEEAISGNLSNLHPVDLADLLGDLSLAKQVAVIQVLSPRRAAEVIDAMPEDARGPVAALLGDELLARVVENMPDAAAADLLNALPGESALLKRVEKDHADDIRELRRYPETTAGGRMTKNFVTMPQTFTAAETLRALHGAVDSHTVDFVYIVDEEGRLTGVCSLPRLMIHAPDEPLSSFMRKEVTTVPPDMDQEKVANIAQRYRLRHVPVVDGDRRLLGVVTLQDIIEVIKDEVDEDIARLAGAEHVDPLRAPFLQKLKARLPWLAAAFVLELMIAWIMLAFGVTLEKVAMLAYFIPVIMAMGGSLGLQSSTMVVRGLATGDISTGKTFRIVSGEFRVGLAVGLLAGIVTGVMGLMMQMGSDDARTIAIIVFSAMLVSLCVAATMGALTPLILQRLKFDPAIASGPFITAINDVVNVTIYLVMAWFLLSRTAGG